MSLGAVKENMESAKLQLEAYSATLTDLIRKIGESFCDGGFPLWLIFKSTLSLQAFIFIIP